jgi:hypothetical protein
MILTVISNRSCLTNRWNRLSHARTLGCADALFALTQQGVIDCRWRRIGNLDLTVENLENTGAPLVEHHRLESAVQVILKLLSVLACIPFKLISIVDPFKIPSFPACERSSKL